MSMYIYIYAYIYMYICAECFQHIDKKRYAAIGTPIPSAPDGGPGGVRGPGTCR